MLLQRIIPSMLLKKERIVKGVRYQGYRDAGSPKTTARAYNCQGADELLLLDIDSSRLKQEPDYKSIQSVAEECLIPLSVGGGIRTLAIAKKCVQMGADKLCLTTSVYEQPNFIAELAHHFGSQSIMVGIDVVRTVDGNLHLFDHRNHTLVPDLHPWHWMEQVVGLGAGEIRLMAVDREGGFSGFDLGLFLEARSIVDVPIILEGGAGSLYDLKQALVHGIDAIALGAMLVFRDANLVKIKSYLLSEGCAIRE